MKTTRRVIQFGFLALTLVGVFVVRGNAEAWCPFGGVEAAYNYFFHGTMLCSLGVSNLYILAAVLLMTVLLRRVFCGYICPIGALSEWLGELARKFGYKPRLISGKPDRAMAVLKYGVLALILYVTWKGGELYFRVADPCYALISRHGEDITFWAYVVSAAVVIGSLFIVMPFCRWFCPLGAVFNVFSRFGASHIQRNTETCIDCKKCSKVCPMAIPVAELVQVNAARCMSCMNCVDVCPEIEAGAIRWSMPGRPGKPWPQSVLVAIMLGCIATAVAAVYAFPMPSFMKERGTRPAEVASLELKVGNLSCRGRATMFTDFFLFRDDEFKVPGYLQVEAWPGPGNVRVRIGYDPAQTSPDTIRSAITEPYFDRTTDWVMSPFTIEGFDGLALPGDGDASSSPAPASAAAP